MKNLPLDYEAFAPPLATDWYQWDFDNFPCPVCAKPTWGLPTWYSESLNMFVEACDSCMRPNILEKVETK